MFYLQNLDDQRARLLRQLVDKANRVRKKVSVQRFRVQRSAPPLATEAASLIKKVTLALPSHIRGFPAESGI